MTALEMDLSPALTQRQLALAQANRIRSARARMKEQIKAGELDVCDLILEPPAVLASAQIGDVVEWAPGIGRWRAQKILGGVVRTAARMESLGDFTRRRVVDRIHEWAPLT